MRDKIVSRVSNALGAPDLVEKLASDISGADLHSLILAVLKQRLDSMEPARILKQSDPVSAACDVDCKLLSRVEQLAYEVADRFEAIELSPLAPLGSVSSLTGLDLGNTLSTIRSYECASDPTVGLALECAKRRKSSSQRNQFTRLCTNQRVVRFPLPTIKGFTAHFKLYGMVTAGRDSGSYSFETASLREHIDYYIRLLNRLKSLGFKFENIVVEVSHMPAIAELCTINGISLSNIRSSVRARDSESSSRLLKEHNADWPKSCKDTLSNLDESKIPEHMKIQLSLLSDNVLEPLAKKYVDVQLDFNMHRLTGLGYYSGPVFHLKLTGADGNTQMMADGGTANWTQKILADRKERLMTSAIGTELLCRSFHEP